MTNDKALTVHAVFDTRATADLAIEHLVQQLGIERTDIFVEAEGSQNTSGTVVSGGDTPDDRASSEQSEPQLKGRIKVSADVRLDGADATEAAFRELGASDVRAR